MEGSITFNASIQSDPTRTLTLRTKWVADWNARIKALQKVIWETVVVNDYFGLKERNRNPLTQAKIVLPPAQQQEWAYRWSSGEKVEEFMRWLAEMESKSLLEITHREVLRPGGEPWSNIYVRSAYQKGLQQARSVLLKGDPEFAKAWGFAAAPSFGPSGGAVSALMQQPFHADRLALAYTRVFDELKGVTRTMDSQISRELANGIAQGLNPRDIGNKIADRVEAIGGARGRLIARTETIHVHQQAALNEFYATEEAFGEVILVQWKATMDSRTRDKHAERNMRVYTKEEAYKLIGEPNCRCALMSFIPATQGMPAKATDAAREAAAKVVEKEAKGAGKVAKEVVEAPEVKKVSGWTPQSSYKECAEELEKRFKFTISTDFAEKFRDTDALKLFNSIGEQLSRVVEEHPDIAKMLDSKTVVKKLRVVKSGVVKYEQRGETLTAAGLYHNNGKISLANVINTGINKTLGISEDLFIGSTTLKSGSTVKAFTVGGANIECNFLHEFGHAVMDRGIHHTKKKKFAALFDKLGSTWFKENVSMYAGTNAEEAFAESFSAYINKIYNTGPNTRLPKEIESFFTDNFPKAAKVKAPIKEAKVVGKMIEKEASVIPKTAWEDKSDTISVVKDLKEKLGIETITKSNFTDEKSSIDVLNKVGSELTRVMEQRPGISSLFKDSTGRIKSFTKLDIVGDEYLSDGKVGLYSKSTDSISISNINRMSRFKLGEGEGAFSIGDSFEDALRHEWAHSIAFNRLGGEKYSEWIQLFYKITSSGMRQHVSLYAGTDLEEAFAECFAAWTHSDYGIKYSLPTEIEEFFKGLLK